MKCALLGCIVAIGTLAGCKRPPEPPPPDRPTSGAPMISMDDMLYQKLDILIQTFGCPDAIFPAEKSGVKFHYDGSPPSVVLSFYGPCKDVFVTEDGTICRVMGCKQIETQNEGAAAPPTTLWHGKDAEMRELHIQPQNDDASAP